MGLFRVSITAPDDDPDEPPELVLNAGDALDAVRRFTGTYRADVLEYRTPSDFLTLKVEPEDADSPALEVERGNERDYWRSLDADEIALNVVTGDWARWDPATVQRKGGLHPDWRWVSELSPFDVFRLLMIPRDHREREEPSP